MEKVNSTAANGVEFDPRYSAIEFMLSKFDSQTDPLNAADNARDVNWHAIREKSGALLRECFDLHVVLWFMRANLYIDGFSAVYQSITAIERKFNEEGCAIFPQAEGGLAPNSFHSAALGWLATSSCLHEIKSSKIFPDVSVTTEELLNMRVDEQEGKILHFSEVVKVLGQADSYFASRNIPSLKEQLSQAIDALERIENFANLQAEDYRLDCRQVRDYLSTFSRQLLSLEQQELPEKSGFLTADVEESEAPVILPGKNIRSRQDVILQLEQVLEYFQNYEPSHPAPILILRSQKMIGMDFATIVEELFPESLASLNKLSGK